jgi:hypothetical protein
MVPPGLEQSSEQNPVTDLYGWSIKTYEDASDEEGCMERSETSLGPRLLPRVGTAQIEATLFTDCFAAVGVEFGRAIGTEH